MYRPKDVDKKKFSLVDQVEFKTEGPGEYTIDMQNIPNPQWQDHGMPVQKGDVIGFYCPGKLRATGISLHCTGTLVH